MSTQAQIEANRRNAQKSTGPRTPDGKARVALNALKHGIRAKALVASLQSNPLFDDDPQAFADHVQALVDHYHPKGPIEEACVEDIAICQWRLRRVVIAETGHIASAQAILLSGPGADNPRLRERNALPYFEDLEKLNRYEISIQRQLKRSIDTLTSLIRQRSASPRTGAPCNPSPDTKQEAALQSEIASIRREVLGYLRHEFGPGDGDPESKSVVRPDEGPSEAVIEPPFPTIDETTSAQTDPILESAPSVPVPAPPAPPSSPSARTNPIPDYSVSAPAPGPLPPTGCGSKLRVRQATVSGGRPATANRQRVSE